MQAMNISANDDWLEWIPPSYDPMLLPTAVIGSLASLYLVGAIAAVLRYLRVDRKVVESIGGTFKV